MEFAIMNTMNEKDIKIKVFEYLLKKEKHSVVVPEVTFGNNIKMNTKGAVRADVFAINGDISIYEIKSAKDSLERLPNQIRMYQQYANKVSVVVADKFLQKLDFLPDEIGIYLYTKRGIKCVKKPISREIETQNYINYWWGMELKQIFRGIKGWNLLHLDAAVEKLKATLNEEQIKNLTLFRLKERYFKESEEIKELFEKKDYENLFPKKVFDKKMKITPLKDIPFGTINTLT